MELPLSVACPLAPLPRAPVAWLLAAIAAVGVGLPVLAIFATVGGLGWLLGGAAFAFTALTAFVAPRARTPGRALAGLLLGCALPPAVLFLPTIIGLIFAIPAGLLATLAVAPLVLAMRDAWQSPHDDDAEHLLAIGSVWLGAVMTVLLLFGAGEGFPRTAAAPTVAAPGFALAGLASALVLARDAWRGWFLLTVERGRRPGYRLAPEDRDAVVLVHGRRGLRTLMFDTPQGDGPFRTTTLHHVVGTVRVPWARMLVMLATLATSLAALATVGR